MKCNAIFNVEQKAQAAWCSEEALITSLARLNGKCLYRFRQRFTSAYKYLCLLPRQYRRRIVRKVGGTLTKAALMYALSGVSLAQAATINVGVGCSLADAIESANTDTPVGSCASGSGADLLILSGGAYTSQFPTAISNITIIGNGSTVDQFEFDLAGYLTLIDFTISGSAVIVNSTISGNTGNGVEAYGEFATPNVKKQHNNR